MAGEDFGQPASPWPSAIYWIFLILLTLQWLGQRPGGVGADGFLSNFGENSKENARRDQESE